MAFTTNIDSVKQYSLGTRKRTRTAEYVYLQGVASVVAGDTVCFDEVGVTIRTLAATQGPIAVAMAAVDATTKYGWFQIYGRATVNVLASFADNTNIYTTSTPGSVDDSGAGAEEFVFGAIGRAAVGTPAAGQAYVQLSYPWKSSANLD